MKSKKFQQYQSWFRRIEKRVEVALIVKRKIKDKSIAHGFNIFFCIKSSSEIKSNSVENSP